MPAVIVEDANGVRVVDENGTLDVEATRELATAQELARSAAAENVRLRARLKKMQTERDSQREASPFARPAREVFDYWREKLAPKAREFNGERFDAVVARLAHGATVEELKEAIDGMATRPYIDGSRRVAHGSEDQRSCDLELICRDEGKVDRYRRYARSASEEEPRANGRVSSSPPAVAAAAPPRAPRNPALEKRVTAWQQALGDDVAERLGVLRGWSTAAMRKLGLGLAGNRVVFPTHDAFSVLTGYVEYQPNPATRRRPKSRAEGERNLFPPPETIGDGATVWLVEGEPDAVAMWSLKMPAVAAPGANIWKPHWSERFKTFKRVVVCFDADEDGRLSGAQRAGQLAEFTDVVAVDLDRSRTDGFDVGDLLKSFSDDRVVRSHLRQLEAQTTSKQMTLPTPIPRDPVADVRERLENRGCQPKGQPDKFEARCPAHDDTHPSLSVSRGRNGAAVIHCHARCTAEQVIGALGMEWADVYGRAR